MEKTDNFAENLKAIRKARKMSQLELANLTGLDKGTISRMERGAQAPRRSNIRMLAEILECSPTALTGSGALYQEIMSEPPEEALLKATVKAQEEHIKRLEDLYNKAIQTAELYSERAKGPPKTASLQTVWARWGPAPAEVKALCLYVLDAQNPGYLSYLTEVQRKKVLAAARALGLKPPKETS